MKIYVYSGHLQCNIYEIEVSLLCSIEINYKQYVILLIVFCFFVKGKYEK